MDEARQHKNPSHQGTGAQCEGKPHLWAGTEIGRRHL